MLIFNKYCVHVPSILATEHHPPPIFANKMIISTCVVSERGRTVVMQQDTVYPRKDCHVIASPSWQS